MSNVPESFDQILDGWQPKWYYRWFPFLPRLIHNKQLRLLTVLWRDCGYTAKSVGKPHFIDYLVAHHETPWYKLKVAGFQIWY